MKTFNPQSPNVSALHPEWISEAAWLLAHSVRYGHGHITRPLCDGLYAVYSTYTRRIEFIGDAEGLLQHLHSADLEKINRRVPKKQSGQSLLAELGISL